MGVNPNNSMLIDIQYVKPDRKNNQPDCLYTIYKDLDTNKKHVIEMESPKIPIYFEKEDRRNHRYPVDFREKEDCDVKMVNYTNIPFEIADYMGDSGREYLKNIFETKNYADIKMLNTYPYVFGHDYDIRTYYRFNWTKHVNPDIIPKIHKGFMDIECDSFDVKGFPNPETCPIDLITIIDGETKTSYTFALVGREYKEPENLQDIIKYHPEKAEKILEKEAYRKEMYESRHKQEEELMSDLEGLKKELHDEFDESFGSFDYKFYFYKDERQMLIHIFQLIHQISPDFLMIWNISFDIPYIMDRMRVLGLNPEEIIPDQEFKHKHCYFKKDRKNFDIKNKCDFFAVTSKTVYLDQMELYGAVRKGRDEQRSFTLNAIAEKEIDDKKLDYSEDGNIKTVGYRNYRKYFIYNIKDVLLQYGIEEATEDCETLYMDTYNNITPYENNFKQTVTLRNVQYRVFDSMGLIPGANINAIMVQKDMREHPEKYATKKKDVDFEGALVGNTKIIYPFGKKMYGKRTNYMFSYSIDMDMTAFYPSTIYVLNISAATLIFKVTVKADQYDVRGGVIPFHGFTDVQIVKDNKDSFTGDIAGEIFDNLQTGNYLTTGHKFMNLPTIPEIEREIMGILGKVA